MYRPINEYEGFYEVNELGQVRSVDRMVNYKDGSVRRRKGRELKPKSHKGGYAQVTLNKNGIAKTMTVHRIVANAFVPNPENLPEVHHINHVRNDNRVKNLKWVTRAEQVDDHLKAAMSKAKKKTRLRVVGRGIDKIYNSAHEVERELGIANSQALNTAKGKFKQAKGYKIYFA